jgi:hypothetical protein
MNYCILHRLLSLIIDYNRSESVGIFQAKLILYFTKEVNNNNNIVVVVVVVIIIVVKHRMF